MTEKYEHMKSESDQKSSKISEVKVGPLLATFLARNYILSFFMQTARRKVTKLTKGFGNAGAECQRTKGLFTNIILLFVACR
jgi:hypothetical protein